MKQLILILTLFLTVNCFSQAIKHIYILNNLPTLDSLTNDRLRQLGIDFVQEHVDSVKTNFKTYRELNNLIGHNWLNKLKDILYSTSLGKKFYIDNNKKFVSNQNEITFYSIGLMKTRKYHYYIGMPDAGTFYAEKIKYDKNGNEISISKKKKAFNGFE